VKRRNLATAERATTMKTIASMKNVLLAVLLLAGAIAHADGGVGSWKGSGTTFDAQGEELGDFTVELTQTAVDAHTVELRGKVTLASGQVIPLQQRRTMNGRTFQLESNRGKGGGACFGAGLCTSYEDVGDGHAYATTIVLDGSDQMRLLITELDHGKAVRFMRQSLSRAK
jgi:hypothetical protein